MIAFKIYEIKFHSQIIGLIMPAIPDIIIKHGLMPISTISVLFLKKDRNQLFAGVFMKDNQEYFVIHNRLGIMYFELHLLELTKLLRGKKSFWSFISDQSHKIHFKPSKRWKLLYLFLVWTKLKTIAYVPIPNAYYIWHEYLQLKDCIPQEQY